jgi:polyphosphate glucokinase
MSGSLAFGIDIGGSGIKGAPVDLSAGALTTDRLRILTPQPSTPDAVGDVVAEIVRSFDWKGPVGVTVPGIVDGGVVRSAANIDPAWVDTDAVALLASRIEGAATVLNDADAAGLAEERYGAGRDADGVVLLLTFGTGIGSALLNGGALVPNTELGHIEFNGMEAEHYCAARLVEEDDMDVAIWVKRVDAFLHYVESLFSPQLIIFGGGISKHFEDFSGLITVRTPVVPASLRNMAGIVGAALASAEATP